jgi:hypothetical protein
LIMTCGPADVVCPASAVDAAEAPGAMVAAAVRSAAVRAPAPAVTATVLLLRIKPPLGERNPVDPVLGE